MPGPFSPTPDVSIQPEAVIAPTQDVDIFSGIASAATGLLDLVTRSNNSSGGSTVDPNLAVFARDLAVVEQIRQDKGDAAGRLAERATAQKFANNGVDFGPEYEHVYKTTTGRDFRSYGTDPEQSAKEAIIQRLDFPAHLNLVTLTLGKGATQDQIVQAAIDSVQDQERNILEINKANNAAGYKWSTKTEMAYQDTIHSLVGSAIGAVEGLLKAGNPPGPREIKRT
jgi:hypothetical protein